MPSAPQGYGNGNAQFAGAGIAGQAGAQWNTTFGKHIFTCERLILSLNKK